MVETGVPGSGTLRGGDVVAVSGTLSGVDQEHKLSGLTEFKTTQGADIVQTLGEWDLPLNRAIYAAFRLYLARRG